jgi:hypothetical protein
MGLRLSEAKSQPCDFVLPVKHSISRTMIQSCNQELQRQCYKNLPGANPTTSGYNASVVKIFNE